jgi:outer membrane lipase/esterase
MSIKRATVAAAMLACLGLPSIGQAQVMRAGNIYDFGDSFQDANYQCTSFGTPLHACSNFRDTPMQFGSISGYTFSTHNDFAVGGTASGPGTTANTGTPPYPGYSTTYPNAFGQIAEFQLLARRIDPNDLVMLTYATNDVLVYGNPGTTLATTVIGNLTTDVRSLIDLGGRNFVLFGGVPFNRIDPTISAAADQAYYTTLNANLPAAMAPFESNSLHLRILDVNTLYTRVLDNPSIYGFIAGDCLLVAGCATAPLAVQNQYAFFHGHPSDAFALIIARYIDNLLNMPYEVAAQADLAQASALAFHDSLNWRLSIEHLRTAGAAGPPAGGVSVFISGNYGHDGQNDRLGASGGRDNAGGLTLGVEYWPTPNLLLGLAVSYTSSGATLNNDSGNLSFDSYQLAGFASLSYPHWFIDGVLSGGVNSYTARRSGVIDVLSATPHGNDVIAGIKGGYMLDVQPLQVGPIGSLTYAGVNVGRYSESGDVVLAQSVGGQSLDSLIGSLGMQLRYVGAVHGHAVRSFAELTAEHEFLNGSRVITTIALDPTSAVQVFTPVASASGTYGRISVGAEVDVMTNVALGMMGGTTFARGNGNQGQVQIALAVRF